MDLQKLLGYIRKAIEDYNMIEEGDKIAIGLSGGKDSIALTVALKSLQRFYPKKFELEVITVSLGFENLDFSSMKELCNKLGLNYTIEHTSIGQIVFDERKEKNPCSLCSKLRKGALNNAAKKLNCNKVALGHNKDDVIQTFLLSLFYEGRINTFSPISFLDKKQIYLIRPLIYARDKDIKSFVKKDNIKIVNNPCPANGNTKREDIKNLIYRLEKDYDDLDNKIFGAIKRSQIQGWKL